MFILVLVHSLVIGKDKEPEQEAEMVDVRNRGQQHLAHFMPLLLNREGQQKATNDLHPTQPIPMPNSNTPRGFFSNMLWSDIPTPVCPKRRIGKCMILVTMHASRFSYT
jgi:hypothetical protein